jgi:hypothetical protein
MERQTTFLPLLFFSTPKSGLHIDYRVQL